MGRLRRLLFSPLTADVDARSATMGAGAFAVIGMAIELAIIGKTPVVPKGPSLLAAAVGVGALAHGHFARQAGRRWHVAWLMANMVFPAIALGSIYAWFGRAGEHWTPFQATKLACIVASMLAPTVAIGCVSILIFAVPSMVQLLTFSPDVQARLSSDELLAVVAFAVGGLFILLHRWRLHRVQMEAARARTEAELSRRLARTFLRLRDLMNTPLQTITFAVDALGENESPATASIKRALDRLHELDGILTRYEDRLEWASGRGELEEGDFLDSVHARPVNGNSASPPLA